MNKIAGIGLAAAAAVVVLIVGSQVVGSSPGGFGAGDTPEPSTAQPTATPEPSVAEPSPSSETGLEGSFLLSEGTGVSVTIPGPGWFDVNGIPTKNRNFDPPDGAYLLGPWEGFDFYIPSDPCQWRSSWPDAPATTLDAIVAALESQVSRDVSEPVDVTVDGHPGKSVTVHVPDDIGHTAGEFDCDEGKFCTFGDATDCHMWNAQGPGAIDELWIVDVDGEIVAMTGAYYPETPPDVVDELQAILGSMTFAQ